MESSRTLIFVQNGHLGYVSILWLPGSNVPGHLDANVLFKSFYSLCSCDFQWCAGSLDTIQGSPPDYARNHQSNTGQVT